MVVTVPGFGLVFGHIAVAPLGLVLSPLMRKFRDQGAWAAWLILSVIVLGGGLIETHSHGPTSGKLGSVAFSGEFDLLDSASFESSTSVKVEFCLACTAGQREGVLDASDSSAGSRLVLAQGVRMADALTISSYAARLPAPRGPPTV